MAATSSLLRDVTVRERDAAVYDAAVDELWRTFGDDPEVVALALVGKAGSLSGIVDAVVRSRRRGEEP